MAIFRKVHTQIWSDPFFSELENEKKIFYLYILTNERTRQCGIYEISKKHMAFDLGISIEKVSNLIKFFSKCGKIHFSDTTNEIAVKNWAKYNYSTSPKVVKCIESELCNVKNRVLIEYIYSIDSVSQEEEEQEEEQDDSKPLKNKHPFLEDVIAYFNENNYTTESATKAFNYYHPEWKDSNGRKVINWKQKMRGVWFKDENLIKPEELTDDQQYFRNVMAQINNR
jgi:hypothetical protein